MVKSIAHVAIVVEDIDAALGFWRDSLGLDLQRKEDVPEQQAAVAFLPTAEGQGQIELVQPTSDTSGAGRFLKNRGPGMHHVCLVVDDIEATLGRMRERGVRLLNETALLAPDGKKYAFIHPESANGVLVELYELPEGPGQA
jgi:methylmalonyl-CoA/ethylmalonyl-CoA epimerase